MLDSYNDTFFSKLIAISETMLATTVETLTNTSIAVSFMNMLHDMLYEQRQLIVSSPEIGEWITKLLFLFAPVARLVEALV
jgi:hypothetical protein